MSYNLKTKRGNDMDPRLQAGLELQLDKQAQQEHDSSLSGVLGQYFKQAYVPVADTIQPAVRGVADVAPNAASRFEQQGGNYQTTMPRQQGIASPMKPGVSSLTMPAPSAADVEAARQDPRFATQSKKTVRDNFASRLRNFLGSSGKRSMLQAGPRSKGTLSHELRHNDQSVE